MLTTLLLLVRAAAACEVDPRAWAGGVDAALAAWQARDTAAFLAAEASARADVACLTGPVDPESAARFHLIAGLARATAGRDRVAALRELRALPPSWRPPEGVAPEGQFLAALLAEAVAAPTRERVPISLGPDETLLVDGLPASDRPDGAALLQALRPGARVAWSALDVPPERAVPEATTIVSVSPPAVPPPDPPASSGAASLDAPTLPPPRPLAPPVATAIAALVGGGATALGVANRLSFDDPAASDEELTERQQASVAYTAVAAAGGAAMLACGVWWVVRW